MERENNFLNGHLNWSATEVTRAPLNYALFDHLQECSIPQLDSSLSSIGCLEGFGNSVSVPLQPQQWSSPPDTKCFSSQSSNSPKLNLAMMRRQKQGGQVSPHAARDAGLAEWATRVSCFGANIPNCGRQFPLLELGRLSRESNNDIAMLSRTFMGEDGELQCSQAESTASEHAGNENDARKRKSIKVGEEGGEVKVKRSRAKESGEGGKDEVKPKVELGGANEDPNPGEEEEAKGPDAPRQDYIHVRARRGQATDAHSLAERVRREKISERMKFLQNLVPGCNKVTGKAVMLDEIINYVRSLQHQVELLSMKLATVNPRLDINVESPLQKDMRQPHGSLSHSVYPIETSTRTFPFANSQPPQGAHMQIIPNNGIDSHCSLNPLDSMLTRRPLGVQLHMVDGFTDVGSRVGVFWGDDLHRVVQMGSRQNQKDMKIKL